MNLIDFQDSTSIDVVGYRTKQCRAAHIVHSCQEN